MSIFLLGRAARSGLRKTLLGLACSCLLLLYTIDSIGNFLPQIREAKASLSGAWYMVQMDTHCDYSAYKPMTNPTSLYQMAKIWADAGYDAVLFKDYWSRVPQTGYISYNSYADFQETDNWFSYSVTGSPSESVTNFSASYPNWAGITGAGRLYVNGTGKAMVSYYHPTFRGRFSLDLHRWQLIDQFVHQTSSLNGNVSAGIEIRFESGKKIVIYQEQGSQSGYSNSSTAKYFKTFQGMRSLLPYNVVEVLSVTGQYLNCKVDYNPHFNITKAYLEIWGQSAYLEDIIFDFRWFAESFDSSSWIDTYLDVFYWFGYSNWDNYIADMGLAESDHDIIIIAGLEASIPSKNQAILFNLNSSGIDYDGTIEKYLTLPQQATDRGGLCFIEELYQYPNGTDYPNEDAKNISDWLNRGFDARAIKYKQWDNALTISYNNEWSGCDCLPLLFGSDLHNGTLDRAMKSRYSMVYAEGTLTEQKIVNAISNGHFYGVQHFYADTTRTNLTINRFNINNQWIMGDWATPEDKATLNIKVDCDVPISDVTLIWNEQQLRKWTPNSNSFSTSIDVSFGGYLRLIAKDENNKYVAYSNPIFIKPTTPYITETTHPLDFSASYTNNKFTVIVTAPASQSSTTEVYCGDMGEPIAIYTANGTLTWSYNTSTTMLTMNATHTSPTRILVYWKFPGDIDSDGDVDVEDLYIIAAAYDSHVGDPTYNYDSDINGDGDIDAADLHIFAGNYGKEIT